MDWKVTMSDEVLAGMFLRSRYEIFEAVNNERNRQETLWGAQSWGNGTTAEYAQIADAYRDACDQASINGDLTWHDIFLEEVFEALTETDSYDLERELIQAIAVAVNWVEDIRSKRNGR